MSISGTTELFRPQWTKLAWHAHLAREFTGGTPVPPFLKCACHGPLGREFKLRPLFAGSIFTFWKRIEPLASTTSLASTPRKTQSTKRTPSITAPGKLAIHITRGLARLLTFSSLTLRTIGL